MHYAIIALFSIVLFVTPAHSDPLPVTGTWNSPATPGSTQIFNFSGPGFSGFTANDFGSRPSNVTPLQRFRPTL